MEESERESILEARATNQPVGDSPSEWIMWMPGGLHEIRCTSSGGQAVNARVQVDQETARAMQRTLEGYRAGRQKPFFDFDHANGPASAWPEQFAWRDTPESGVYAKVTWSESGAAQVRGLGYRAFSPCFRANKTTDPMRVVGAPLNMGGLVNDPAFDEIQPLWAKQNNGRDMSDENKNTTSAAAETVTVEVMDAKSALKEKDTQIAELQAANTRLDAVIKVTRKAAAKAAVDAAVTRGALPAQDTELQAKWAARIEADPDFQDLLAQIPGAPALSGQTLAASRGNGRGDITVLKEDTRRIITAYAKAPTPLERGAIYCRDIKPLLVAKDELVLQAANTLGTVTGELIVQRSLDLLKQSFPVLGRISTDFTDEHVDYGQTVKSRTRAIPAVTDYSTTTGYAVNDATTTDVPVTINGHKGCMISFNANELGGTRRLLFGEQEEGMHYAIGKTLVDALYALITAGNYTNSTVKALASFTRNDVTAMAKALYNRGVPPFTRSLLLNPDYFEKLQQDAAIVNLAAYQKPEVITEYTLPPVAGFQIYQAVNLPTAGSLTGFGFTPDAWVMATRVPNDYTQIFPGVTAGGVVTVVTNPDTGVSVMVVQFIDHKLGAAYLRVALMYGVGVGQAASGQRLTSV